MMQRHTNCNTEGEIWFWNTWTFFRITGCVHVHVQISFGGIFVAVMKQHTVTVQREDLFQIIKRWQIQEKTTNQRLLSCYVMFTVKCISSFDEREKCTTKDYKSHWTSIKWELMWNHFWLIFKTPIDVGKGEIWLIRARTKPGDLEKDTSYVCLTFVLHHKCRDLPIHKIMLLRSCQCNNLYEIFCSAPLAIVICNFVFFSHCDEGRFKLCNFSHE